MLLKMISFSEYYKQKYGHRVFKLGLSTGIDCPKHSDPCYFCVKNTFTDENITSEKDITNQINYLITKLKNKIKTGGYIAYFQDNTSSFGDINYLQRLFTEAAKHQEILELIISTRPDYLYPDFLEMLKSINKPVTIELGIQTVNDKSLCYLNRGHTQADNQKALDLLKLYDHRVGIHIILGIPGESHSDIDNTINWINENTYINDVKIHHLAVFKDSKLADIMKKDEMINLNDYIILLKYFLSKLREDIVISRLFTSNLNRHEKMMNDFPGTKREWMNRFFGFNIEKS